MKQLLTRKNTALGALALVLLLLPVFIRNNYVITTLVYCFIFSGLAVSWNLIGGYGGQTSWCHAVFVAVGAYTSMILFKTAHLSPFFTIFIGMGIAFLLATAIGYGTFRLRGPFFSLSTIAFAEIVRILIQYFGGVTGGAAGYYVTYTGNDFKNLMFQNDIPFYYILLFLMVGVIAVASFFVKSKIGHYLGAIAGDEDAAISLGIRSFKVKLSTFQVSAVIASAIGVFYGFFLAYIDPVTICSLDFSVKIAICAIIGGLGTIWGPVMGAFVVNILTQLLNSQFSDVGGLSQCLYGLILIVVVIFRPAGLISFFTGKKKTLPGKEAAK